jgi:transketolase
MRHTFVNGLLNIIEKEDSDGKELTYLLTGDIGFSAFEKIREEHPKHFMNMGLSEQNMVGVSAGMAKLGKKVFIYSIIPFLLYRTFEQVRNDICYPNLPVRMVGVGAGLAYANAGATHQPVEDLRIAGALPNLTVLSPSDPKEVELFMQKIDSIKGPAYMRLSRNDEPMLHGEDLRIDIGKALRLTTGNRILIVSSGILTKMALEVAGMLNKNEKDSVEVLEMHTFKPFDYSAVVGSAEGKKIIVTIEDSTGALAEKVATALVGRGIQSFISFKLPDEFTHVSGTKEYLFKSYGISAPDIYSRIKSAMK